MKGKIEIMFCMECGGKIKRFHCQNCGSIQLKLFSWILVMNIFHILIVHEIKGGKKWE